ncbi:hypothetical protein Tco_0723452 [Tanacetum coccineum]
MASQSASDSATTGAGSTSAPTIRAAKQKPEFGKLRWEREGNIFMFNPDYLREQFAGLVIQRGLPFNHFDHEQTTRVFQNTMQPRYTHVSRSTLKRDAMKLWVAAKQATIDGFDVEEGVFNDEVQQNEATQLTDQEIALDASSDGSFVLQENTRDYMMTASRNDQTGEGGSMSQGYTYY